MSSTTQPDTRAGVDSRKALPDGKALTPIPTRLNAGAIPPSSMGTVLALAPNIRQQTKGADIEGRLLSVETGASKRHFRSHRLIDDHAVRISLRRVTVSGDSRASRHSRRLRSIGSASRRSHHCPLHQTGPCDVKTRPPADRAPGSGDRRTQQPQPAGCAAEEGRG